MSKPSTPRGKFLAVRQVILDHTFKTLGVKIDIGEKAVSLAELREWFPLAKIDINPTMCGPVGAMFANISCGVTIGYVESDNNAERAPQVHLTYTYDYNHSNGGHNGYTARFVIDVPATLD